MKIFQMKMIMLKQKNKIIFKNNHRNNTLGLIKSTKSTNPGKEIIMITLNREELVSKKGNITIPNVFVSEDEIINYA